MKRKVFALIAVCAFLLTGCNLQGDGKWALPSDAPTYQLIDNEDDGVVTVFYNGRTYVPYGTVSGRVTESDIKECIGSIRNDGRRLYLLNDDKDGNFIMVCNIGGIMDQPEFWRASDTKREKIYHPDYITPSTDEMRTW